MSERDAGNPQFALPARTAKLHWKQGKAVPGRVHPIVGVEAQDSPFARVVDGEIARNRKEPWLKTRMPIVGMTTLQNSQPRFLYQVVDGIANAEQEDKVADKAILILLDQCVQKSDISVAKAACDVLRIGVHGLRQCHIRFEHTRGIRIKGRKLRMDCK